MRALLLTLFALALLAAPPPAGAAESGDSKRDPRILKVLPHYLDREGRHMVSPSLFDRDAYQFELRQDPSRRSGMRFDVLWKMPPRSPAALDLRVELRGTKAGAQNPVVITRRAFARGGFSQWTRVPVTGEDYERLGELISWRVSLLQGDQVLASQQSFLW